MSLDLWLVSDVCKCCGRSDKELYEGNHTYNTSKMWYSIYPEHKATGMIPIEAKTGKESLPILIHAYEYMVNNKEELIKLNPPNGWGSYDTFLSFITDLMYASRDNPDAVWYADR